MTGVSARLHGATLALGRLPRETRSCALPHLRTFFRFNACQGPQASFFFSGSTVFYLRFTPCSPRKGDRRSGPPTGQRTVPSRER